MNEEIIKKALLEGSYVNEENVEKAEDYAARHKAPLTEYLFNENFISTDTLGQAIGEYLKVPYVHITDFENKEIVPIPLDIAKKYRLAFVNSNEQGLTFATDILEEKNRGEALSTLQTNFPGKQIVLAFAQSEEINQNISGNSGELNTKFAEIIKSSKRVAPEIIDQIVRDALSLRASDIHLEPQEKEVVVRFRIDGVLAEAGIIPKEHYEIIVNRVKIQAGLRIDEHTSSQDGAIRFREEGTSADLRVSIIPTLSGEKIVMRVLAEYLRGLSLGDLGIMPEFQKKLMGFAERPYGMILTVGPTGSGKTTTLYALLKVLNEKSVNITTIEDPVEYRIPRINQVQVNAASNLSFANGLRTIVRQDPDIILVGEIRDLETAEIAINASLTGHLLLSTFHANDASTVVPRLVDMKIEPFLLSSTLMVIIAQRLARRICPDCKVSETSAAKDIAKEYPKAARFFPKDTLLYKGKGCDKCNHSGYKGQLGLFEFIEISKEMQDLIMQRPTAPQIAELARKEGAKTFFEDGLDKVKEGLTTLDELMRVALPPSE